MYSKIVLLLAYWNSVWSFKEPLQYLDVSNNSLSGNIPSYIGAMVKLVDLSLGINKCFGPLPLEIGNLVNLVNLYSPSCLLRGPIPKEIGNMRSLENYTYQTILCTLPSQTPLEICKTLQFWILWMLRSMVQSIQSLVIVEI